MGKLIVVSRKKAELGLKKYAKLVAKDPRLKEEERIAEELFAKDKQRRDRVFTAKQIAEKKETK